MSGDALPSGHRDPPLSKLLVRAGYTSAGAVLSRLAASVAGIVVARGAGPSDFGVYAAIWALMDLGYSFTELGLGTGLKRDSARRLDRLPVFLGNAVLARCGLGLSFLLLARLALPHVSANPLAPGLYPMIAAASLSILFTEPFLVALQVRGEQLIATGITAVRGVLLLAGTLLLAAWGVPVTVFATFHALLYVCVAVFAAGVVARRGGIGLAPRILPTQIAGSLAFGVSSAVKALSLSLPLLLLSRYGTEVQVGHFAVASRLIYLAVFAGGIPVTEVFLPELFRQFRGDQEQFRRLCAALQRLYAALGIVGASALCVGAELVLVIIQGEAYRGAAPLLRAFSWSLLLIYASIAADAALTAGDLVRHKIWIQGVAAGVIGALGLALVPRIGAGGAVVARLAGDTAVLVLMGGVAWRRGLLSLPTNFGPLVAPALITLSAVPAFLLLLPGRYVLAPLLFVALLAALWRPAVLSAVRAARIPGAG